jgi:hypothetical protein
MMATPKQAAANRRNAQRSTGPKTPEGRHTVSQNAVTHGLTATRSVVLPEEQDAFDRFAAALREQWSPEPDDELEQFYVDRMIQCAWRLRRITRMETGVLLALRQAGDESTAPDPAELGNVYQKASPILARLARHERQLERSLRDAQTELDMAQYARQMNCSPFYLRHIGKMPAPGAVRRKEEGQLRNPPLPTN